MIYRIDPERERSMIKKSLTRVALFFALAYVLSIPIIFLVASSYGSSAALVFPITMIAVIISIVIGLAIRIPKVRAEVRSLSFEITDEYFSVDSTQQKKRIPLKEIETLRISPNNDVVVVGRGSVQISIPREVNDSSSLLGKLMVYGKIVHTKSWAPILNFAPVVALGFLFILGYLKLYTLYLFIGIPFAIATTYFTYTLVVGPIRWKYKLLPIVLNLLIVLLVSRNTMIIADSLLKGAP